VEPGTLLGLLKDRGFRTLGVDFSAEAAHVAEVENGVRVLVGSLEQAAFPDQSFDIVTLFHVMETCDKSSRRCLPKSHEF
jgi:2-polyprenyl-3-methyl-5-hydroxy-6-metoxy-1,4-benzoquinol methylase